MSNHLICLQVGEVVELDIVRGYPLPYDNTDTRLPDPLTNGHHGGPRGMGGGGPDIKRAMSNGSINVNDLPRENNMNQQRQMLGSKSMGYLSDGEGYRSNGRQQQGGMIAEGNLDPLSRYYVLTF